MGADDLDGRRLEEDWNRALDAAGQAVSETERTNMLSRKEAAAASDRIRGDRKWLSRFKPSLHKLFPSRAARDPGAD
jgi:hypothetical protein